ncbi:Xaa-Pro dipeptidase [Aliikangiella marina]|uniref:Xaa-Pro dipeptidase n=1 Tax=Aliikangiella marina TaxID=1712262 RepID=A0A545T4J3_9GAMM|nr:Xaa-Pro dipeptidase [Aliikangiella marina]TQV72102.1 Xaa-Pro dipeptidase [Aliikangiella marina]
MSNLAALYGEHLADLLARHRQIMQRHDIEYLVVPSGTPIRVYQDDMDYPFKSSFLFRTYVPLTELPHSYLVIGLTGKPQLIYFQPEDYWHTPPSDPEGIWPQHFDIEVVSQLTQALALLPKDAETVAILGEQTEATENYLRAKLNPLEVINAIYWQRAYKSDYEIACLLKANQLAAHSHKVAEESFRAGKSEQQIHLAYVEASGMMEHQMPYGNIVALNEHAAILHYQECQSKVPATMRSFLIDAGVSFNGYHSDITRTYSFEQNEFAELIAAMDEMQLNCIASIETGQQYLDLHIAAHQQIAHLLKQFNFVDMSPESMVESGVTATFFPHGLGHLIGLQVHDVGGQFADQTGAINSPPSAHPFLRSTRNMEPRMAFTIEPGLYFIDMLLKQLKATEHAKSVNWERVESFKPFGGIRIEDDIVVQENGVLNLTREAFAAL